MARPSGRNGKNKIGRGERERVWVGVVAVGPRVGPGGQGERLVMVRWRFERVTCLQLNLGRIRSLFDRIQKSRST